MSGYGSDPHHNIVSRDGVQSGTSRRMATDKYQQELEIVRRKFYEFQMNKAKEIEKLVAENKTLKSEKEKVISHSKSQSVMVQHLRQECSRLDKRATDVEELNAQLYQRNHELETQIEKLQREKKNLADDITTAKSIADVYKEDFEKERSDRARTAGKLESLERHAISHAQNLAENFQKESSESEAMTHSLEVQLRKANEDIKTKIAQVKGYRQQVEYLQQNLKEAEKTKQQQRPLQQEEMMQDLQVDETSSQKGPKLFAFAKKQKQKAEEKARMKAEKKERERSVREGKENRRRTITEMDKAKLKEFLEAEINRLETENLTLRNKLQCAEETTKSLIEKLDQTEAVVVKVTSPPSDDKNYVLKHTPIPPPPYAESHHHHIPQHKQSHKRSQTDYRPVDKSGLSSKTMDYVNFEVVPSRQSHSQSSAQSPVEGSRMLKAPKPAPRSASLDVGKGGPLLPASDTQQPTSMPSEMDPEYAKRQQDISNGIDDDIRSKAAEVIEIGRDERRLTLTSIPFDPFLECLYCNQRFRYGEIQKYRKHVNECSGGTTD